MRKIEDLDDLKDLTESGELVECFISASGLKFSKSIQRLGEDLWWIYSHVGDTEEELTTSELWASSNIGDALDNGNLYIY